MKNTIVESTIEQGLCTSCGVCNVICPQNCIEYSLIKGQYLPQIDEKRCVSCGKCKDVCASPVVDFEDFSKTTQEVNDLITGDIIDIYNLASKNYDILREATSGGAVTTIVEYLLNNNIYDIAFLIDTFQYDHFITTEPFWFNKKIAKSQKSRYISVSHQKMLQYACENYNKKIIVIATSCAIHTIENFIKINQLNREKFLFLGLFCDRTLNYNVFEYFKNISSKKKLLKNLYFRTKEKSGWPGNVKLEYTDGTFQFLNAEERMVVKDYFQLERCLYCLDKLNRDADISFGDNYTGDYMDKEAGENTVIIRTTLGKNIFQITNDLFHLKKINKQILRESQHLDIRKENITNIKIKLNKDGISSKARKQYNKRIKKIRFGQEYLENRKAFKKRIFLLKKKRSFYRVKREIKGLLVN